MLSAYEKRVRFLVSVSVLHESETTALVSLSV